MSLDSNYPYDELDRQRPYEEASKPPWRDPFTRDRARVLHSWSLRRLADKTQVVFPGRSDFPRTRLTHTLEVAQISREIGAALGADPDLCDTAGLCHDLGHPPFGHNGEAALNDVAQHIGGFEGNAQSLRILTRLEPKVFTDAGVPVGLNLTRASMDAMIKYPWIGNASTGKYNAYEVDSSIFQWIRHQAPVGQRSAEAQIMDWADDVAYSVHDIEDAFYTGLLRPAQFADSDVRDAAIAAVQQNYAPELSTDALLAAHERLLSWPQWPHQFTASLRELAALKQLTSSLIGRFCTSVVAATQQANIGPLYRYHGSLVLPQDVRAEVNLLKAMARVVVFHRPAATMENADQREILTELVQELHRREGRDLPPWSFIAYQQADSESQGLRVIIDQVAALTDEAALRWHQELCAPAS